MEKKIYCNPVIPGQFADPDIAVFGDKYYLYIIMSKDSICMIDKITVKPQSEKELKEFLANKTKLDWLNEKSFLLMNLADVILIFRNRKNK